MKRVGIISAAHMHYASYAQALKSLDNVELVGIYDNDAERGQKAADSHGCQFFADLDELLAQVDGVVICSENSKHKEFTIKAAQAKKDILCEKPIATNVADAKEMIRVCEENGVRLMIAFPCRFNTPLMRVKQLINDGAIGDVIAIKGTNHGQMPGGWFVDPELSGGGAVMDHTVHVVDLIRWMLGKEVVNVYAEVDNMLYDVNIDDCGMLSMELEGGIFATQDPSWSRPRTFPTWGDVTLFFVGTKGSIELDAFAQYYTVYDDANNRVSSQNWGDDMDFGLIKDFVDMLYSDRPASIDGNDGLQAMAVALAAYRSGSTHKPVSIEEILQEG